MFKKIPNPSKILCTFYTTNMLEKKHVEIFSFTFVKIDLCYLSCIKINII